MRRERTGRRPQPRRRPADPLPRDRSQRPGRSSAARSGPDARPADAAALDALWREVEVVYASYRLLPRPEQAPRLRWVQLHSAGADHDLVEPLAAAGVTVTTASGVHAIPIAEYVFGMLLAWAQHLPARLEWRRGGAWPARDQCHSLLGREGLWGLDRLLLIPHVSGFAPVHEERTPAVFAENLRRYLAAEPLLDLYDPGRGH